MEYSEVSDNYYNYINSVSKEFEQATGMQFTQFYSKIRIDNLLKSFKTIKTKEEMSENFIKLFGEFSTSIFDNMIEARGEISTNHKEFSQVPTLKDKIHQENDVSKKKEMLDNFLKAFNTYISKIGLAYLKEHELDSDIEVMPFGGISSSKLANTFAKSFDKEANRYDEYDKEIYSHPRGERSNLLVSNLKNITSDIERINVEHNDPKYINDKSNQVKRLLADDDNIRTIKQEETSEELLARKLEGFASRYTSLRDSYHAKPLWRKWLTFEGWKESRAINNARDKMKDLFGYNNNDDFNFKMKEYAYRGTSFTKDIINLKDKIVDDFHQDKGVIIKDIDTKLTNKEIVVINENLVNDNNELDNSKVENIIDTEKTLIN